MADIDNVINAMELCVMPVSLSDITFNGEVEVCPHSECPYFTTYGTGKCITAMVKDATALLKAQQPRVMTLEEIWDRGDDEPLFLEYTFPTKSVLKPAIFQPDNSYEGGGDGYMCVVSAWYASGFYNRKEYGKTWRCWTSRPDEKVRAKTPWES